ncbi:MAG TPA: hypothetical protein VFN75_00125 [Pseudonocardiaceae bacterium]|nr:hypothetical protein [Pseudonocardiaceae bacterium]
MTSTTAIDPCPYCGTSGVQATPDTPSRVRAWSCPACRTDWAVSVVNPHLRNSYLVEMAAAVEEIGRLRRTLAQVITLADQAPALTDCELRNRLLALASTAR